MFGFLKNFRSSMSFMTRISDEIGVDRKVFQTALTEVKVNFSACEQYFTSEDQDLEDHTRMRRLCMMLIPQARIGAAQLRMRFGDQPQLEKLVFTMMDYQKANLDVVEDPETYRRNAMI